MLNRKDRFELFSGTVKRYSFKQELLILKNNKSLFWDYIQGVLRSYCYLYFPFILRKHIIEQFEDRALNSSAKNCIKNGNCLCCGCDMPDVLFCTKGCSVEKNQDFCGNHLGLSNCYNPMVGKKEWNLLKRKLNA